MLGPEYLLVAFGLRLLAGAGYLIATVKGTARPNPVTWLFWGLTPLVAFVAQVQKTIEPTAWMTLAMSVGPLLIFCVSLTKGRHWKVGPFDILCGASAAIGIVLWQITSDPVMAIIFGIVADILGGVPTLRKAYVAPESEKAFPYFYSILSMIVTLLTVHSWDFLNYAFPLYMLAINVVIFTLVAGKVGKWRAKVLDNTASARR